MSLDAYALGRIGGLGHKVSLAFVEFGQGAPAAPAPESDLETAIQALADGDAISAMTMASFALRLAAYLLPAGSPIAGRLSAIADVVVEDAETVALQ